MRSKAPLVLMEQLVMVLVFALATALCVRAFAVSGNISRGGAARDQAVILAQSAAETYKSCGGDAVRVSSILGGEVTQDGWYALYDGEFSPVNSSNTAVYQLEVLPQEGRTVGLGKACVNVRSVKGNELLIGFTVAWQEVPDVA